MLKLEIKMDEEKIKEEKKYTSELIYQTIDKAFLKHQLRKEVEPDGTRVFYGTGNKYDYGAFGLLITTLSEKTWFITSKRLIHFSNHGNIFLIPCVN